jgi:hypothetical protein
MSLLKVLLLVCLAASLSLLIPVTALANDHPWDDNHSDSSRILGTITVVKTGDSGCVPTPFVDNPILKRISDWVQGKLREAHQAFSGQVKQETKGTVTDRHSRPETPVAFRKHK